MHSPVLAHAIDDGMMLGSELASLGADGYGFSDTRGAARRHFHIDAPSIVLGVLTELARSGDVKREALSEAVERYQLLDVQAAGAGPTGGEN